MKPRIVVPEGRFAGLTAALELQGLLRAGLRQVGQDGFSRGILRISYNRFRQCATER